MTIDLLTASGLTAAFSLLLSLIFILIPPARRWFVGLSAENQQAITGGGILVVAAVAVALGCAGIITFIACSASSIGEYALTVVLAAIVGDRVSKAAFAGARWWDTRAQAGAVKSLNVAGGKLLH